MMLPHSDIDIEQNIEQQHLQISGDLTRQLALLEAHLQRSRRLDLADADLAFQIQAKDKQIQQLEASMVQLFATRTRRTPSSISSNASHG